MAKVNVYVKEESKAEYSILEHFPRNEAVEKLQEMLLEANGLVPEWVKSVNFYVSDGSHGDIPIESYHTGDTIELRGRGRPAQDKATRAYTLDRDVAAFLDAMPEGQRSKFVNEAIKAKMPS